MDKLFDKSAYKLNYEIIKFATTGAANFAITFILFYAMLRIVELNYLLSLIVAWIGGMFFSYIVNFLWVFKPEQKIQFRARFFKYFFASAISIAFNLLVLGYIVKNTNFDPFYVQIALIPLIVIINFSTAKYWSLRRYT